MKHVLYTSYDGLTDNLGQSQIIPYITGLAKYGFQFTVLSCEKRDNYEKRKREVSEELDKFGIEWCPVFYTKRPPVLSTVYDLCRMYIKGCAILKKKKFALIHSRAVISAVLGYRLKKRFGTRFVFDMRGFWADERAESGMWNLAHPLYKCVYDFFKKEEREIVTHADYVVCLTEKAKATVSSWIKADGKSVPVDVIPCCADLALFSRASVNPALVRQLKEKFRLTGNEFILSYLGSIGTWYMLEEMLDFFKCLQNKIPGARFLFITNESAQSIIDKASERHIEKESLIIEPASRVDVPTYLSLSDWSIFFIKPVFSKSGSSPTKQGEIMGMGIPHFCNAGVGDVDEIMQESNAGIVIHEFTQNEYNHAIDQMISGQYKKNSESIVLSSVACYSLESGVAGFKRVYEGALH